MKILAIGDRPDPGLWDYYNPQKVKDVDLIISCGDLKPEYLEFLVTMVNRPLLFVHGNHDGIYDTVPPEGCDSIEDRVVTCAGLRIAGLGGGPLYSGEKYQYSEREMGKRVRKLRRKIRRAGGLDILVTHSPMYGCGDMDDVAHQGFAAFGSLLEEFRPQFHLYAHVHPEYGAAEFSAVDNFTKHVNCSVRRIVEADVPSAPAK